MHFCTTQSGFSLNEIVLFIDSLQGGMGTPKCRSPSIVQSTEQPRVRSTNSVRAEAALWALTPSVGLCNGHLEAPSSNQAAKLAEQRVEGMCAHPLSRE